MRSCLTLSFICLCLSIEAFVTDSQTPRQPAVRRGHEVFPLLPRPPRSLSRSLARSLALLHFAPRGTYWSTSLLNALQLDLLDVAVAPVRVQDHDPPLRGGDARSDIKRLPGFCLFALEGCPLLPRARGVLVVQPAVLHGSLVVIIIRQVELGDKGGASGEGQVGDLLREIIFGACPTTLPAPA